AAFAGLDGRVYVFVKAQYYRFSSDDYTTVDAGFPKNIVDDWGGLQTINAAFTMDGKTYLFGLNGTQAQYVCYSTNDYRKPDDDYPKEQKETTHHWWHLPDSWTDEQVDAQMRFDQVDAVFNAPDKKTYLFSAAYFTYFDHVNRWWAEPQKIADKWTALPAAFQTKIDAALCGKDGKTYFFSGDQFVRFSDAHYCEVDKHYPKSSTESWGHNAELEDRAKCADFEVTGAMSLISFEQQIDSDENETIDARLHTYLFSGDLYYRYLTDVETPTGTSDEVLVTRLEADYPKTISELKNEPRFRHFNTGKNGKESVLTTSDEYWLSQVDAVFADQRNVYFFRDSEIEVVSTEQHNQYATAFASQDNTSLSKLVLNNINGLKGNHGVFSDVNCVVMHDGGVYLRNNNGWVHHTSAEGYGINQTVQRPALIEVLHEDDQDELTTVLQGTDGNTYFFKQAAQAGENGYYYDKQLDKAEPIAAKWGKVRNNIDKNNQIDAVLQDSGKTYVFSGDQYVVYPQGVDPFAPVASGNNPTVLVEPDKKVIRSIFDDYGLDNVDIAYQADDVIYLIEKPDVTGGRRYVRLDSCDQHANQRHQKSTEQAYGNFWQMPINLIAAGWDAVDAVINQNQLHQLVMPNNSFKQRNETVEQHKNDILLFIKNREFVSFDKNTGNWTEPGSIEDLWGDILNCEDSLIDELQSLFIYNHSTTVRSDSGSQTVEQSRVYFLGEHCYQWLVQDESTLSPYLEYKDQLGLVAADFNAIDASYVYQGKYTYLFFGNRYVRYTGQQYCHIDEGYPKYLETELSKEPGFTHLPETFATTIATIVKKYAPPSSTTEQNCIDKLVIIEQAVISGVISNGHNTYIYINDLDDSSQPAGECLVFSDQQRRSFSLKNLAYLPNHFSATGTIDAAFTFAGATYLFSGDQYIRYAKCQYDYPDKGYPKKIADNLLADLAKPGVLNAHFHRDLDGATVDRQDNIYLFKDKNYINVASPDSAKVISTDWKIDLKSLSEPLCQPVDPAVSGQNDGIFDGAFVDESGHLYVIKGDQVLRYADTEQTYFEKGYPKRIDEVFKQLPQDYLQGVQGAFTFAGNTYLVRALDSDNTTALNEPHFVRYPTGSYHCLHSPHKDLRYPQTFVSRWGQWADYRLGDLHIISCFKQLNDKAMGETNLADVFKRGSGYFHTPFESIAQMFDWDVEDLQWLKRKNGFLATADQDSDGSSGDNGEALVDLELLCRINTIQKLATSLRTSAKSVYEDIWFKRYLDDTHADGDVLVDSDGNNTYFDRNEAVADKLLNYLAGKYCGETSQDVLIQEMHNHLNLQKRDAMLPFILAKDSEVEDARDLYEKMLIDVNMGECMETSRVKEAIAAVQLYFHRLFLNLEPAVIRGQSDNNEQTRVALNDRWDWFKNYRVWEANRKVFLYPENYIRPELRDTKTEQFKAFEDLLSQGTLNNETLQQALGSYVESYAGVSNLTIAGGYVYDHPDNSADKEVILFAHSKSQPKVY
ncbi:MAG: hypothetical protein HRT35_30665, partial [Algicola sp.]|nr:hypothetical protein [Algicola sp.]